MHGKSEQQGNILNSDLKLVSWSTHVSSFANYMAVKGTSLMEEMKLTPSIPLHKEFFTPSNIESLLQK
jgi:hypothetical protein